MPALDVSLPLVLRVPADPLLMSYLMLPSPIRYCGHGLVCFSSLSPQPPEIDLVKIQCWREERCRSVLSTVACKFVKRRFCLHQGEEDLRWVSPGASSKLQGYARSKPLPVHQVEDAGVVSIP